MSQKTQKCCDGGAGCVCGCCDKCSCGPSCKCTKGNCLCPPATATVQLQAPYFKTEALMPNGSFKTVSLDEYKGKWLVLMTYPLDFTFVCPTEITNYSDRAEEFKKLGCEVLACSVDSKFSHLAWTKQERSEGGLGKMQIPILEDLTKSIATSYGVLIKDAGVALRGIFIIDPKSTLRQITINDLPVGRNVDETLRLVQAFQFVEKHGEVCPAGWKPGAKTMKADPKGSQEYFKAVAKRGREEKQ